MKKVFVIVPLLGLCMTAVAGNNRKESLTGSDIDTLRYEGLQEVVVKGIRANQNAPFAVTNVNSRQLRDFSKTGQELPFLLSQTPGILAWGENGLGTGTAYMRIRGAGDSRINVTIDGVPLNSPEDQCVFWANMNSYASLLGSVQVQRGVGTSTNGDGAFGGTVSLSTRTPMTSPMAEVTGSYGSYNTWKAGARFSTGLLGEHFILDGAYNETNTDGFLHGTGGRSGSYYGGLTWVEDNFTIRYKNIGNFEKTGQAWNGVIAGDYDGNVLWDENGVPAVAGADYATLYDMGYGKWNSLVEHIEYDWAGGLTATPYVMKDGSLWGKTTDNFWQNHNILSIAWQVNDKWSFSNSWHYTHGYGYYREFKHNSKLAKFGLPNLTLSDGSTLKKTDFVRQKGLTQDTWGDVMNINFKNATWDVAGGLSFQRFDGNHFGYLTYMANDELEQKYMADGDYKYYDSDAGKTDFAAFVKATLSINRMWDVFADLQYRFVNYATDGYNDKYYSDLSKNYLDIDKDYNFLNPKAGVTFHNGNHKAYASIAMSHREPERNNFTDNGKYPAPKAEQLLDIEAGYEFTGRRWHAGINLYYMGYRNQFVQTGETSDIGEMLTTNVKSSYRMGAEVSAGVNLLKWLSLDGNLALSDNRIKDFDEMVAGYDADWNEKMYVNHYDNSVLAYSPSFIGNVFLSAHWKGLRATWHTQGVSRQYLDNSECRERSIAGYCVSNVSASYTFRLQRCGVKAIELGAYFNNIFNRHYAQSGFVWYQYYDTGGQRLSHCSYIPSAGFTSLGSVTLSF